MTDPIHAQLDALDRLRAEARLKQLAESLTNEPVPDEWVTLAVAGQPDLAIPACLQDQEATKAAALHERGLRTTSLLLLSMGPVMTTTALWILSRVHGDLGSGTGGMSALSWCALGGLGLTAWGTWLRWGRQRPALPPATPRSPRWRQALTTVLALSLGVAGGMAWSGKAAFSSDLDMREGSWALTEQAVRAYPAQREALRLLMNDTDTTVGQPTPEQCTRAVRLLNEARETPASLVGILLQQALDGNVAGHGCLTPGAYAERAHALQARAHQITTPTDVVIEPFAWLQGKPSPRASILAAMDDRANAPIPRLKP